MAFIFILPDTLGSLASRGLRGRHGDGAGCNRQKKGGNGWPRSLVTGRVARKGKHSRSNTETHTRHTTHDTMSGLETHHDPLAKLNGKQKKTVSFDPMANITGSGGAANKAPNPFAKDATPVSNIPGYNEDDSEKEDDFMSVADILKVW